MKTTKLIIFCGVAFWTSSATAHTFTLDYNNLPTVDPAEGFEADCWGPVEAPDCSARAALLEAELVNNLSALSGRTDPATVAVFESVVDLPSTRVQEVALRYFADRTPPPVTLSDRIREFFFGSESSVGYPAADIMERSTDTQDQALAERYRRRRTSTEYGGYFPQGTGFEDSWAVGTYRDLRWDRVEAFAAAEVFQPADRLLMIDDVTFDYYSDPMSEIPVTGFVTDAPAADLEAHFTSVFGGAAHDPLEVVEARYQALQMELTTLQPLVLQGDQAAVARVQAIAAELPAAQAEAFIGERLGLRLLQITDQRFWSSPLPEDMLSGPSPRGVAIGTDPILGRTVIRYINGGAVAPSSPPGESPDGGLPPGAGPMSPGDGDGRAEESSGCACAETEAPESRSGVGSLAILIALGLRRRRAHSSGADQTLPRTRSRVQ